VLPVFLLYTRHKGGESGGAQGPKDELQKTACRGAPYTKEMDLNSDVELGVWDCPSCVVANRHARAKYVSSRQVL